MAVEEVSEDDYTLPLSSAEVLYFNSQNFLFRRTLNMFRVKDKESSGVLSSYLGHWLCPECVFF
jgi:hypothetical protein